LKDEGETILFVGPNSTLGPSVSQRADIPDDGTVVDTGSAEHLLPNAKIE
jgi:ABC-type branched-subunit amino acid transport system ATPase component